MTENKTNDYYVIQASLYVYQFSRCEQSLKNVWDWKIANFSNSVLLRYWFITKTSPVNDFID